MEFFAPTLVRVGALATVLAPAAFWFTNPVDNASDTSWLFGTH